MNIISLKDFIITGQFGNVGIGSTKEDVIKTLGQPDSDYVNSHGSGELIYAWYEFFYYPQDLKIVGIQNDHLTTLPESKRKKIKMHKEAICYQNDQIVIDTWFLKPGHDITYREVIAVLQKEKIRFEEKKDEFENYIIQFESGVTMDFDDLSGLWIKNDDGIFKQYENIIQDVNEFLLQGIRLFDFS
jgi:hypothetical protein